MSELVQLLMDEMEIDEDQARGGAGLLLKLAKEKLGDEDFAQIDTAVGGADELIDVAPEVKGGFKVVGNLAKFLGNAKATDLTSLVSGFSSLRMDREEFLELASLLISFVQDHGGDADNKLFTKIMS